jgi:membrane protein DedA with SNARE-associated domain
MHFLHQYLNDYGYVALFLFILVESLGIPAPGQTILIATAVLAAQGKLNIAAVLGIAFTAAFVGNIAGYLIGVNGGHRLVMRFGRYVRFGAPQLRRVEQLFERYGIWFVLFARFFEVLRQLNGIVAGTAGMRFRSFLLPNALGAALWVSAWGLGGWHLGQHIHEYEDLFEETGTAALAMAIVGLTVILALLLRFRWRKRQELSRGPGRE